jgi:putative transposase
MEVSGKVIECALNNAKFAYNLFFKNVSGHPVFKKKKENKRIFSCSRCYIDSTSDKMKKRLYLFDGFHFYIGGSANTHSANGFFIKTAENILFLKNKKISKVNITFDGSSYYAGFSYEEDIDCNYNGQFIDVIGIDLGIKSFAVQSDGKVAKFPKKRIVKIEQRIKRLKSILSKKEKGSNNYNKVKTKLSKCYKKIHNITWDFLHKYTTYLCLTYKTIKIETLAIKNLIKNHRMAKAIIRNCFYNFRAMLEYKSKWYNCNLILVDRFYPSSKNCYYCGNKKQELKLSDRIYHCNICGYENDRDLNAAYNLREWIK